MQVWSALEDTTERLYTVDKTGHRGGVRALALSSDSSLLLSAAESSIKVWNPNTLADIRSIPLENGLCLMFAPGRTMSWSNATRGWTLFAQHLLVQLYTIPPQTPS